jgi:hypothetical protein
MLTPAEFAGASFTIFCWRPVEVKDVSDFLFGFLNNTLIG